MIGQSFKSTRKSYTRPNFTKHQLSNGVENGEKSNVVVQTKKYVGPTTPSQTTPKSAKSPVKQPLRKSPIRPPKSIKDGLKNLSPIKPEKLKQK